MTTETAAPPGLDLAVYREAATRGELVLPRCDECSTWHFYPRSRCPACGSAALRWAKASGRGTLYSFTVVHRAPSPAFAAQVPYVIAAVALEEGPHMMSRLVDQPADAARIGQALAVRFADLGGGIDVPVFAPVAA
jgi:uncharacterized OB-fold protein